MFEVECFESTPQGTGWKMAWKSQMRVQVERRLWTEVYVREAGAKWGPAQEMVSRGSRGDSGSWEGLNAQGAQSKGDQGP